MKVEALKFTYFFGLFILIVSSLVFLSSCQERVDRGNNYEFDYFALGIDLERRSIYQFCFEDPDVLIPTRAFKIDTLGRSDSIPVLSSRYSSPYLRGGPGLSISHDRIVVEAWPANVIGGEREFLIYNLESGSVVERVFARDAVYDSTTGGTLFRSMDADICWDGQYWHKLLKANGAEALNLACGRFGDEVLVLNWDRDNGFITKSNQEGHVFKVAYPVMSVRQQGAPALIDLHAQFVGPDEIFVSGRTPFAERVEYFAALVGEHGVKWETWSDLPVQFVLKSSHGFVYRAGDNVFVCSGVDNKCQELPICSGGYQCNVVPGFAHNELYYRVATEGDCRSELSRMTVSYTGE